MPRRTLAIAAWLVGLALCAWQIAHTRFAADLSSFLPSAPTPEQRLLVDQLREGAVSRLVLIGIEGDDAETRARVSRALAARLRADERFAAVLNGVNAALDRERELVLAYRYVMSPAVGPERFTVEGLRAAVGETLDLLASPAGMALKSIVPRDPTGEVMAVLVESIRGTLAGDLSALTRTYSVGLEGTESAWRLRMRPLDPALTTLVERIEIAGAQAQVKSVEIHQSDGDRSVMTLAPVAR